MTHNLSSSKSDLSVIGDSHDIKTLVNGVLCMTSLLENTSLNIEQAEILQLLRKSAMALDSMMTTALTHSQNDISKNEAFNLNDTLKTIFDTFNLTLSNPNIKTSLSIEKAVPATVKGNKLALIRILNNLLSNAGKFTTTGEINLKVSCFANSDKLINILFEVSDTGRGISQDQFSSIFHPFTQYQSSGFGLGLSIVKELVEKQNGEIAIQSEVGKGTTFSVELPFKAVSLSTVRKVTPLSKTALKGKKILIIDDDEVYTKYLTIIIGETEAEITSVRTAKDAFKQLEKTRFDLIITDMQLPDDSGYNLAYSIRNSLNINRSTPIAAMTAGTIEREKLIVSGIDDVLPKPLPTEGVLGRLHKVLTVERLASENNIDEAFDFSAKLNAAHLKALYGNDIEHAAAMFEIFLDEILPEVSFLKKHLESDDLIKLKDRAHRLKPACSMVGLTNIENHLLNIERHIFSYNKQQIFGILREIDTDLANLTPILEQELLRLKKQLTKAIAA